MDATQVRIDVAETSVVPMGSSGHEWRLPLDPRVFRLTAAEMDVLAQAALGRTNLEIAEARGGHEGTVRIQLSAVYRKLGVRNRSQAVHVALRAGLLDNRLRELANAPEFGLAGLLPHATFRRYAAGKVLFRKGESGDTMFLVLRGTIELPETGSRIGPRGIVGEVGVFAECQWRTYTARCVSHAELFELEAAKARLMAISEPGFALKVIKSMACSLASGPKMQMENAA